MPTCPASEGRSPAATGAPDVNEPHRYSFSFEPAGDGFAVRAKGDLDCDEDIATFEIIGTRSGRGFERRDAETNPSE